MHSGNEKGRILKNAQEDAERLLRHAQEDAQRLDGDHQEIAEKFVPSNVIKKDKMHTIGEMSSRLAHDLQNPLTIIKNTIELLNLKNPSQDKARQDQQQQQESL